MYPAVDLVVRNRGKGRSDPKFREAVLEDRIREMVPPLHPTYQVAVLEVHNQDEDRSGPRFQEEVHRVQSGELGILHHFHPRFPVVVPEVHSQDVDLLAPKFLEAALAIHNQGKVRCFRPKFLVVLEVEGR